MKLNPQSILMENIPEQEVYFVNQDGAKKLDKCRTLDTSCRGCYGKQNAQIVYSFDSLSSNSMKSSNPNSGCREVDVAKTLDTTVPDPSKNQGGVAVVYPLEGNGARESHRGPGFSESDKMFTLNTAERHAVAYCIQGNMVDRETKQLGSGIKEEQSFTLNTVDRHAVVQMSTTGGQNAYAVGNGQTNQSMMGEKTGALNCMHDQIAIMQEIPTEQMLPERSALTMDEDSTDKMLPTEN